MDELWATFSVVDHKTEIYRRSLVLFDRIVIPVLNAPIDGVPMTALEIDQLSAEVDSLVESGAAIRYEWDEKAFVDFEKQHMRDFGNQYLAAAIVRRSANLQSYQDSRQLLVEWTNETNPGVVAIPAYSTPEAYNRTRVTPDQFLTDLTVAIEQRLQIPIDGVALPDILHLRATARFAENRRRYRHWLSRTMPELMTELGTVSGAVAERRQKEALDEFDDWLKAYGSMMGDSGFETKTDVALSLFELGVKLISAPGEVLVNVVRSAFALTKVPSQFVTNPGAYAFAPAALVYEANQVLKY